MAIKVKNSGSGSITLGNNHFLLRVVNNQWQAFYADSGKSVKDGRKVARGDIGYLIGFLTANFSAKI